MILPLFVILPALLPIPKGIMLTHRNYTANVQQSLSLIDIPPHFITLLILPWDHSFAHTCGIYTVMKTGASLPLFKQGNRQWKH